MSSSTRPRSLKETGYANAAACKARDRTKKETNRMMPLFGLNKYCGKD
jgi:hypothetical protein